MPQSLVKDNIHLIFSTKNRRDILKLEDYHELRLYTTGILSELGCYLLEMGGTENHVHILFVLNKTKAISEVVGKIKSNASRWLHNKYEAYIDFEWQHGYAAFSVSESKVGVVTKYIQNQVEHHKKESFEDEYRTFLKAYNIEWDERYVWE